MRMPIQNDGMARPPMLIDANEVVDPGVLARGGEHAERDRQQHRDDRGQQRQLEGQRQANEQLLDDRAPRPERGAEIEVGARPTASFANWTEQRLVQPELVAHGGDLLAVDPARLVAAEDEEGHVARG